MYICCLAKQRANFPYTTHKKLEPGRCLHKTDADYITHIASKESTNSFFLPIKPLKPALSSLCKHL